MMDEVRYQQLADAALRQILAALDTLDGDVCDSDRAGDVLTLTFASGLRCVINTQRPTRQLWLAARTSAWHFAYAEDSATWVDEKGTGKTLFAELVNIVAREANVRLPL
jgi:CyaY protein